MSKTDMIPCYHINHCFFNLDKSINCIYSAVFIIQASWQHPVNSWKFDVCRGQMNCISIFTPIMNRDTIIWIGFKMGTTFNKSKEINYSNFRGSLFLTHISAFYCNINLVYQYVFSKIFFQVHIYSIVANNYP